MIYGSVCSGIEAATVAWHPLGWTPAWFAEIAKFPSAVLAHHYPKVPNHGDFTRIQDSTALDLLVGGTPCQDFSVAGLRAGLDGERGNLSLEFLRLAQRTRPRWVVWENVPGVLSIDNGRAFGSILGGLAELGYGWAYRVLDAQFYGVPQRRRRVFVVGYLGDWRRAAAVLFERACLSWDPPPSRAPGADVAGTLGGGAEGRGWCDDLDRAGAFVPELGHALTASNQRNDYETGTFVTHTLGAAARGRVSEDGTGRGTPIIPVAFQCHGSNVGPMGTLRAGNGNETGGVPFLAFHMTQDPISGTTSPALSTTSLGMGVALFDEAQITSATNRATVTDGAPSPSLSKQSRMRAVVGWRVRRLLPRECERLQGMPDDYTAIRVGKRQSLTTDGPRYAAIGNSMAVPVMAWLGRRIAMADELGAEAVAA